MPAIGQQAPAFDGLDQHGIRRRLTDFKGQRLILYFYPKDMTSGCTQEACDFRDDTRRFEERGVAIVGVSPDSVERHARFAVKEGLNFPLLADTDHAIAEAYGVWKEKSLYGRKYMGVERTTFLIDGAGRISHIWPKVRVSGHVKEVASAIAD